MDFELLKQKAFASGINQIELYEEKAHSLNINFFDETIDQREENDTNVFAIRGVYNNQIATIYVENDDNNEIDEIIKRLKEAASSITKNDPFFIYGGDENYTKLPIDENDFDKYSLQDKIDILKNLASYFKSKAPYFYHVQLSYEQGYNEVSIINSNGLNVCRKNNFAVIVAELICQKDGEMKNNFSFKFLKKLKDFDAFSFADDIIEKTVSQFDAITIPSNSYKVVLSNEVVSSLLGVYQSIFYANSVKDKLSFLENSINKKVFGDNVTLVDDPFLKASPFNNTFDDEGVATRKNTIVENGYLKTFAHNLSTAAYFNTKTTGNGFKSSTSKSVGISFNTLCLEPGETSFTDLLCKVNDGVLITDITGLHAGVNVISGDFNVQCSGYLIKNGKKDRAVTLIVLSGKFQDLFNNIKEIANDCTYYRDVYAPSIYIESMNISGK